MARPLRIELAGGLYHVTARGDRREAIYFSDDDRQAWLDLLGDVCERFNWRCHAWCEMSNHYHLVVETPEGNLARGMRQLNGVYTQYVNRSQRRVGHLFQGRYKAILIEKDPYLLEVARYVVLNPVRAGMVKQAGVWPWSSYRAMVGEAVCPEWLERDWLLGRFGKQRRSTQRKYADFVRAGVGQPPIWEDVTGQVFLGSEAFAARMRAQLPDADLREVPRRQRRAAPPPLSEFVQQVDCHAAMAAAYGTGGYTLREIADAFGVHYATVSRAVRRAEAHARRARVGLPAADGAG